MTRRLKTVTSAIVLLPLCLLAQTAPDPSAVLKTALAKLVGTGHSLLQYTCLETIERSFYSQPAAKLAKNPMTEAPAGPACSGREFNKDGKLTLDSEDRLRLQVAVADGKEISSWAAASRFDSRSVWEMVPTGVVSTGAFGTGLMDIFENSGTHFTFVGKTKEGWRELFVYSFDVSFTASNWGIMASKTRFVTAYHGTFIIDPDTVELTRVISETDELRPESHMCRIRTTNDYHYLAIGDGRFLIPFQAEFDTVTPSGGETRNVTTFSACHEYSAESKVVFGEASATDSVAVAKTEAAPLPAGLSLTLALAAPIDTSTAAAGDSVSARVTKAVRAPKSNAILIPAGAIAHGRILNMQRLYSPAQFQDSLLFESLEQNGAVVPLSVQLENDIKIEKARTGNGLATRGTEFSLAPVTASGEHGGSFAVPGANSGYVIPAGYESKWITVAK